jgi:transcriptional pleiotropic regulator of transition state genes
MKAVGIVRKVDQLGRVVLPKELRRALDIKNEDSMEIFVDGENVVLKKFEPLCVFCGHSQNITVFKEKNICSDCMGDLLRF